MALPELFARVRSGVFHINFILNGATLASGSAFLAHGKLVTNNHVFRGPENADVVIRRCTSDPSRPHEDLRLVRKEFSSRLIAGSDENNYDYAILDIPEVITPETHDFRFAGAGRRRIGESVVFLGYPLEHRNLVCHAGIISSTYKRGVVQVLQIDGSVNASNSGGPLITLDTGEVLGIITRKATGLSQMFNELQQSFNANIALLQQANGFIRVSGFDPARGLVASQQQLKRLAAEIERSANVGIGYAFSAEHILEEGAFT